MFFTTRRCMPCEHSRMHTCTNACMHARKQLPPTLLSEDQCRRCFANKTCALYHKAVEEGTAQSSGMGAKFDEMTGAHSYSTRATLTSVRTRGKRATEEDANPDRRTKETRRTGASVVIRPHACVCGLLVSLVGAEALRGQVTVDGLAGHLTAAHCAYFKKWDAMMSLEEQQALAPRKEACSMPSAQREKQGNCSARIRVVRAVAGAESGASGRPGAELVVTFERFDSDAGFERLFGWARRGLTDLGRAFSLCLLLRCCMWWQECRVVDLCAWLPAIVEGDSVTVRAEGKLTGPVREGVVEEVTCTTIAVRLPKGLDDGYRVHGSCAVSGGRLRAGGGGGAGAREAGHGGHREANAISDTPDSTPVLWRIDRAEYGNMWSKARGALARFFLAHSAAADEGFAGGGGERDSGSTDSSSFAAKHRRFIVDLEAPAFDADHGGERQEEGREHEGEAGERKEGDSAGREGHVEEVMNEEQRVAVRRVLAAKDYVLLLGAHPLPFSLAPPAPTLNPPPGP